MKLCPITSSFDENERLQLSVSKCSIFSTYCNKKTLKREAAGPFFNITLGFLFQYFDRGLDIDFIE